MRILENFGKGILISIFFITCTSKSPSKKEEGEERKAPEKLNSEWGNEEAKRRYQKTSELSLIKKNQFQESDISFLIVNDEGISKKELNTNEARVPASVMKLVTSRWALAALGKDFRFETRIKLKGEKKENGKFVGDIYLIGGGDPLLRSQDLMDLVSHLKEKKIKAITGDLFFDDYLFSSREKLIDLEEDDANFAPGLSALALDFNQADVFIEKNNDLKFVYASLPIPYQSFTWQMEKNDKAIICDNSFLFSNDQKTKKESENWQVLGSQGEGKSELPIKRPSLFAANMLKEFLRWQGIEVKGEVKRKKFKGDAIYSFTHLSPPLSSILEQGLEFSNNLIFELIRERLIQEKHDFFSNVKPKQISSWKNFFYADGSGLSPFNRISAKQLMEVVRGLPETVINGFPLSSKKGTLAKRMRLPWLAYRVWAKTGSMSFVNNLAGVFYSLSGKKYYFVLMINSGSERMKMDQYLENKNTGSEKNWECPESILQVTDNWKDRARNLQEDLLSYWIVNG